jgi:hypothetical protein
MIPDADSTATDPRPIGSVPHPVVCVVGDTFAALAEIDGVTTVSRLAQDLKSGAPLPERLVAGQGVSDYELEYVVTALRGRGASAPPVEIEQPAAARVSRDIVHKHRESNVLLADLERVDAGTYGANLRLHAENELMQDHQTGQHVQGIVIVEAVRQMFIAVFEAAHGARLGHRRHIVVWDSLDLRFTSFLFPLPARISCEILDEDLDDPVRMSFHVRMEVEQGGVPAAIADVRFGVHDYDRIRAIENKRADKAVRTLLETPLSEVRA